MSKLIEGKFHVVVNETPNSKKHYICYFCEEEVVFAPPSDKFIETWSDSGVDCNPQWRHLESGHIGCQTRATPSNLEIPT